MEWLKDIGFSGAGLPWWAAFALMLLTLIFTKGLTAWRAYRGVNLEERKYEDGEAREAREALVAELKEQVKELKASFSEVLGELKEVRSAHAKCEIEQAKLQGQLDVMKEKIARLESHDKRNEQHVEELKKAIEEP